MSDPSSKPSGQINSLQVLRGVAALLVVFHHVCACFASYGDQHSFLAHHAGIAGVGACGVDIFFVISGFVMTVITAAKPLSQRSRSSFMLQRLVRIVPLYWIYTTCMVFLLFLPFTFANTRSLYTWPYILKSYAFIPAPNPAGDLQPLLGQGWTLIYEMMFYVVFAIFLRFRTGVAETCISILFLVVVGVGSAISPTNAFAIFFTDAIILEFCLGMLAGIVFLRAPPIPPAICLGLLAVSVAAFSGSVFCNVFLECQSGLWKYRVVFWGIPALALVLSLVLLEREKAMASWPWLLLSSGDRSYSIYLTHGFLILPIGTMLKRISLTSGYADAALVFVCVLCIVPGLISYRFIEAPLTKYLRDAIRTFSSPAAT